MIRSIGRYIGIRQPSRTPDLETGLLPAPSRNTPSTSAASLPGVSFADVRLIDATTIGATTGAWCALLGAALGRSHDPVASIGHAILLGALQAGMRHVADNHFLNKIRAEVGLRAVGSAKTLQRAFLLGMLVGLVNSFNRSIVTSTAQYALQRYVPASADSMTLTTTTGTPEGTYTGLLLDLMAVGYAPFAEELLNRHNFLRGWFALRSYAYSACSDTVVSVMSDARALHLAAGLGFGLLHVMNDHAGATLQGIETGVLSSPYFLQLYVAGGYGIKGTAAAAGAHFFHNSVATLFKHVG